MKLFSRRTLKPLGTGPLAPLRLTIAALDREHAETFAEVFARADSVEVIHGDLLKCHRDALLSPANSFGDMGGGVDQAIDSFYSGRAQPAVQQRIASEFLGEIPVGCASIIEMGDTKFPFLICAPTMRIPGRLSGSINAYLALRAALLAVTVPERHPSIQTMAVPCLCTGVGGMPVRESAVQMFAAYRSVLEGQWKAVAHPAMAPFA